VIKEIPFDGIVLSTITAEGMYCKDYATVITTEIIDGDI